MKWENPDSGPWKMAANSWWIFPLKVQSNFLHLQSADFHDPQNMEEVSGILTSWEALQLYPALLQHLVLGALSCHIRRKGVQLNPVFPGSSVRYLYSSIFLCIFSYFKSFFLLWKGPSQKTKGDKSQIVHQMKRKETWKSKLTFVRKSYFCMQNRTTKAFLQF